MAIKFLKQNEIVDANRTNPLPTEVIGAVAVRSVDTLLAISQFTPTQGIANLSNLQVNHTDLLGSTAAEQPTLTGAGQYRGLVVLMAFPTGGVSYHYRVYGRATDPNGEPFTTGWAVVKEGTFSSVPPNSHLRVDIGFDNAQEVYYDQYRIVMGHAGSGSVDVYAKVVGIRF